MDTVPLFESWEGTAVLKHIQNTIHVGLVEYFESLDKIEKVANFILPGHDMKGDNRAADYTASRGMS